MSPYNCVSSESDKCKAQIELYNSMKDPILTNLLNGNNITPQQYDPTKFGGLGWMNIPTNNNSGLTSGSDQWKKLLNEQTGSINFLIIKKYDDIQSKLIYKALNQPKQSSSLIFDNQGNLGLFDDENKPLPIWNPMILTKDRNASSDLNVSTNAGNTISNRYGTYMDPVSGVYFYNTKVIMNPTLGYILYTKDTTTSSPSYYLLYNPIHRKEFQNYYRSLLEYTANAKDWVKGPQGNTALYNPGTSKGYETQSVPLGGSPAIAATTALSFKHVMAKYCNAFKIQGDKLPNGANSEHYADPSCNLALSEMDSQIAFVLGSNYTQSTLIYNLWAQTGKLNNTGYSGFKKAQTQLSTLYPQDKSLYWPCSAEEQMNDVSPYSFCQKAGLFETGSTSFMLVLANAYINYNNQSKLPAIPINNGAVSNSTAAKCLTRNINIVTCKTNINIAGEVSKSQIKNTQLCGDKGSTTPPPSPSNTPVTPTKKPVVDYKLWIIIFIVLVFLAIIGYFLFLKKKYI